MTALGVGRDRLAQRPLLVARDLAHVQQPVHAGQQLDEDAEIGSPDGATPYHLSLAQPAGHAGPRVAVERLQAECDPPLLRIDPQDFHRHRLAHAQAVRGPAHPRMGQLGERHQPVPRPGR